MDKDFVLETKSAKELYHNFASNMPIIDYHCHLSPKEIAEDIQYDNLTQIWLYGDHYKWRAMRAYGLEEKYVTGEAPDEEKFMKWAEVVPNTLRNPLYHWTHLELQRFFDVHEPLSPKTARSIYDECNKKLRSKDFSARKLMQKMKVEVVCTTDDPLDDLQYHKQIKEEGFSIKVLPTWRPDKAMAVENSQTYIAYINKLAEVTDMEINSFESLIQALKKRQQFFHENGCRLSDHGLEEFYAETYTEKEINEIFTKALSNASLDKPEIRKFKSAMLFELAKMDAEKNWVQQYHYGVLRNNNSKMMAVLGPDTGFDSIGDFSIASNANGFFDKLEQEDKLAKTILYNINPKDNEVLATMIGNFNKGPVGGKMQFGSAWWFLDQKDGMEKQINALSNLGLLSKFVGMLTDSRSFLSYPRHEYFRRILCNLLGEDMEKGLIPADFELVGSMVENICYYNAKNYFKF